ncbi:MAG: pyruvate dehydrogenase (acetyl-transferring) E1 component subunit alpha [Caldilineaceae bacterium]|nr:pyruvate dehydrogenase (acetyl-transferring) E1 component subunit alpha [Caldilineaceae bacterium]MBP9075067.1 pyruvate dehydrogenase (acetyl-transferring) E1 component subunit alpha [Caldilineaceae bacterium]
MTQSLNEQTRQDLLRRMLEIRIAEEQIQDMFLQNLIQGTTHLCIGQEACSTGVALALEEGDSVTCTYRGHGHALALGMSMKSLMAEMMGKESGCCHGKGGSMHMTDASIGLLGANAIVGAQLPIAVGAALTSQVKGEGKVAVTFFGDGATNIGAFHEALNMAAIWKLPVIFCCENNLYGEYSAQHKTTPVTDLAVRAQSYNMPGVVVDGQDVETVYAAAKVAVDRARRGDGPTLLELKTYRYRGHSRTDTGPYRPPGELDQWMQRDPIDLLRDKMIAAGQLDETEFDELKQASEGMVYSAIEWAKAESFPPIEALYTDIYYEG